MHPEQYGSTSDDLAAQPVVRPGAGKLVWYWLGGSLPRAHSSWVLHDLTVSTWALRYLARISIFILPAFALFMVFMPTPFGTRFYVGLTGALSLYLGSMILILVDNDRRAIRAGFTFGLPAEIRSRRATDQQRLANHARRERIASRRARR